MVIETHRELYKDRERERYLKKETKKMSEKGDLEARNAILRERERERERET
jgi:hypothetical protein